MTDKYKEVIINETLIQTLLQKCIDLQNNQIATIFFNFSGHCNLLTISFFIPQWEYDAEPTNKFDLYFSENYKEIGDTFEIVNQYISKLYAL